MHHMPTPKYGQEFLLDPAHRLCAQFDAVSVAKFPVADRDTMGLRVLDDCAHVHIM